MLLCICIQPTSLFVFIERRLTSHTLHGSYRIPLLTVIGETPFSNNDVVMTATNIAEI